jgi:hypothetical protein
MTDTKRFRSRRGRTAKLTNDSDAEMLCPFQRVLEDPELLNRVLVRMTLLNREDESNGDNEDCNSIRTDSCINDGFRWTSYPPLLAVLNQAMEDFFANRETNKKVLAMAFNNHLVATVRRTADDNGLNFTVQLGEKQLRNRIRSFYKRATEKCKKRFMTMAKKPYHHRDYLLAVLRYLEENKRVQMISPMAWERETFAESLSITTVVSPEETTESVSSETGDGNRATRSKRRKLVHLNEIQIQLCTANTTCNSQLLLPDDSAATETPVSLDELGTLTAGRRLDYTNIAKWGLDLALSQEGEAVQVEHETHKKHMDSTVETWSQVQNAEVVQKNPLISYEAPAHTRIPEKGTHGFIIWKRLQSMRPGVVESCPPLKGHPWTRIRTLHELVRCRLASGMLRSALQLCHNSILQLYQNAECIPGDDALESVRSELAGTWCLYAHLLWEIGAISGQKVIPFHESTDQESVQATFHHPGVWERYAVAVLHAASFCPLVGNHWWITLAMGRLTILKSLQWSTASSGTAKSTESTTDSVRLAIGACWDCIDRARGKSFEPRFSIDGLSKEELSQLANHHLRFPTLTKERVTANSLEKSFGKVSSLLSSLRSTSNFFRLDDKTSMAALCSELNRLSRLKDYLGQQSDVVMVSTQYTYELDVFPLFQARDRAPPAPLQERKALSQAAGSACMEVEHACTSCCQVFDTVQQWSQHESSCDRRSPLS